MSTSTTPAPTAPPKRNGVTRQAISIARRRAEWRALGLCPRCGSPPENGKRCCTACLDRAARDYAAKHPLP